MNNLTNILVLFLIVLLLGSCTGSGIAPVATRNEVKEIKPSVTQTDLNKSQLKQRKQRIKNDGGYHIVTDGDTLYSIAWRYNLDYKDVSKWNNIKEPYTIYPDQFIRLKRPPIAVTKKKEGDNLTLVTPTKKPIKLTKEQPTPLVQKQTTVTKKIKQPSKKSVTKPPLPTGKIKWNWPTIGKIIRSNSPKSKKGIDIAGKTGQNIKAAATGEVVYSGNGLFGFGNLIIIKHSEAYLSAYAYNEKILVQEGDRVKIGQTISTMGKNNVGANMLHFEIRKNGKPVNPIRYLPK